MLNNYHMPGKRHEPRGFKVQGFRGIKGLGVEG